FIICSNCSGGFGSYLFGMSETIAKQATEANDPMNIKNPHLGWIIGFMFLVSFVGLFALVPMRKVSISLPFSTPIVNTQHVKIYLLLNCNSLIR
ncbi:Os04g0524900, partial [Oryza sativa Japonica Group]